MGTHRYLQAMMVVKQPGLALLRAERSDQKSRVRSIDIINDCVRAHLLDRAEAGVQRSHANHPVGLGVQNSGSGLSHALRSSEQEHLYRGALLELEAIEDV